MSAEKNIEARMKDVKALLKKNKLSAVVIPTSDPHNTEYLPDHWCLRAYLSGFTGSAGTLLITETKTYLWTDFRYWIQAEQELQGSGIELMKLGATNVPDWPEFCTQLFSKTAIIGYDPMMFMAQSVCNIEKVFAHTPISFVPVEQLAAKSWKERPLPPNEKVFDYSVKYAGKSRIEKIRDVRDIMKKSNVDFMLISSLYDIAWLLNLRGNDTPCVPIFTAFASLTPKTMTLYVDAAKISSPLRKKLNDDGIQIKDYTEVESAIQNLKGKQNVIYTATQTPMSLVQKFPEGTHFTDFSPSLISRMKAIKNAAEIKWALKARVHDGVALVRFFAWLDRALLAGEDITEAGAAHILDQIRLDNPACKDLSFHTIAGYNANAALCHYQPSHEHPVKLERRGLLLVDSGGQYLGATTDVTRTVALGKVNAEMIRDYTLTLKGHLAIARQRFPEGTPGGLFDMLAREYMWNEHITFGHGTGHGIGAYLNVHEGPPGIYARCTEKFGPGIMVTNEPGIYREGKHGIRIENVLLVVPDIENEFGKFDRFEPLTYFPYDRNLIDVKNLSPLEIKQINAYHAEVFKALSPALTAQDRVWLKKATAPIRSK